MVITGSFWWITETPVIVIREPGIQNLYFENKTLIISTLSEDNSNKLIN